MPKEDKQPEENTSYNIYFESGPISSDSNTETVALGPMSPYYLYSTAEMALLLNKAEVTVRLEARKKGIGIRKDGRWWFTHENRVEMMKEFDKKRRPRGAIVSGDISIPASIMQRQDMLAQAVRQLALEHRQAAQQMWHIVSVFTERFERIEERLELPKLPRLRQGEKERGHGDNRGKITDSAPIVPGSEGGG